MASITCTNCGAVLKTANPIAAGKKIKCPKCQELFVVAEKDENEDEEAEEEAPKKKGKQAGKVKKKSKATDDEDDDEEKAPKKSSLGMFLGIGCGVLLLCCCTPTGVTGYVFYEGIQRALGFVKEVDQKLADAHKEKAGNKEKDKDKTKTPIVLKPDFTLKPEQIADEFQKNPESAAKKYDGKVIEFTGQLREIGFFGQERKLGVSIEGGNFGGLDYLLNVPVQPADRQTVYRLTRGQLVKIVAPHKGGSFGRFISFDTGSVTEIGKSTIREVTSEKLAAEYAKDSIGADNKFRDQTFLVAGTVLEVKKDKDDRQVATLKSGNNLAVKVRANALGSAEVDKLTAGKTAVIRVDFCSYNAETNTISLSQIVVTDLEPGKTPEPPGPKVLTITVEELARDVDNDRNNYGVKYAGNEAVITGVVEQVTKMKGGTTIQFKTDTKTRVYAIFVGKTVVAKGDTIQFRVTLDLVDLAGNDIRFLNRPKLLK